MAVRLRFVLKRSAWKILSLPTVASKRLRGAIRGGFLSSFSVPGAGMLTSDELYCDGKQELKPEVGVALTPLQVRPAWACWSKVRPLRSTGVVVSVANGTAPATRPES